MTVDLAPPAILQETLFHFLQTLYQGQPRAGQAVLTDQAGLQALYDRPRPELLAAVGHNLELFLVELGPDPTRWGPLAVSPAVLGLALALNNLLAPVVWGAAPPSGAADEPPPDPALAFTAALVDTLPPAAAPDSALLYHALLRRLPPLLARLPPDRAALLAALFDRSPLTGMTALAHYRPAALNRTAAALLPWRPATPPAAQGWPAEPAWLAASGDLISRPPLARWLRHCWLALPPTRTACCHLGLLLEMGRQAGWRRALLDFYEAYAYFQARPCPNGRGGRCWPLLETIEPLLRVPGDSDAALAANHRGSEYFLLFQPLLRLISAEKGLPADYNQLDLEFYRALRRLVPYVAETTAPRMSFGPVAFDANGSQTVAEN